MQRPSAKRQDTFDLRNQISSESNHQDMLAHADAASHHQQHQHQQQQHQHPDHGQHGHYDVYSGEDSELDAGYSVMEHDSDGELDHEGEEEAIYEDDMSSELSIPDESINFDLVYSLHSFAATVEGQANVVKGDSLILMDDSNSYWWLVKVLKTQEVGYIPAENIETPFERLARLNKHRNVDLASPTEQEREEVPETDHLRIANKNNNNRTNKTPSPRLHKTKSVQFNASFPVHRYLPAVWNEEEEEEDDGMEWDDVAYIGEDPDLAVEERERELAAMEALSGNRSLDTDTSMDVGVVWDKGEITIEQMQEQARARQQQLQRGNPNQQQETRKTSGTPTGDVGGPEAPSASMGSISSGTTTTSTTSNGGLGIQSGPQTQSQPQPSSQFTLQQIQDEILRPKRRAEEESSSTSIADEVKKRLKGGLDSQRSGAVSPASTATTTSSHSGGPSKLRKEPKDRDRERDRGDEGGDESGGKKKKSSVLRNLFGRNKDKDKDKDGREKDKGEKGKHVERGASIGSLGSFASSSVEGSERGERELVGKISEENLRAASGSRAGTPAGGDVVVPGQLQQQQQQQPQAQALSQFSTPERPNTNSTVNTLSPHANQLRQRDMQQQALYQQYLNRSPSSPPESSYGLQSAAALMASSTFRSATPTGGAASPVLNVSVSSSSTTSGAMATSGSTTSTNTLSALSTTGPPGSFGPTTLSPTSLTPTSSFGGLGPPSTPRQRPGSLILIPGPNSIAGGAGPDGQGGPGVPDLSVMRVFAGRNLQTEATFKTVLLNTSTTAQELVKQAIQRFRLPEGSGDSYSSSSFIGAGGNSAAAAAGGNSGGGEEASWINEYYLTVKRVEGGASAVLRPTEKPLVVFESLVMQAMQEQADALEASIEMEADEAGLSNLPPTVKRSSVGSISSVTSNLSMHPAIRKLPMNDFTDDSAVRFYLNRRTVSERERADLGGYTPLSLVPGAGSVGAGMDGENSDAGSLSLRYRLYGDDDEEVGDHTIIAAEASHDDVSISSFGALGEGDMSMSSTNSSLGMEIPSTFGAHGPGHPAGGLKYLTTLAGANVPQERFSSPSLRFALQLVIHPGDLPDDMAFHPYTEAIVPRETLPSSNSRDGREREREGSTAPFRRKVFMFPKNVTVAEVIELGLERFGILEGVVDGGDEVEDKLAKRRSTSRVRYGLCLDTGNGQEKELSPTSKVVEAFPRPPTYRTHVPNFNKRRSVDSANLLGNMEDVNPDDPVFILRRSTTYRNLSSRRLSAPLDEIALQQLHHQRDSTASSTGSDYQADEGNAGGKQKGPPSRQEIIAQRAATRANQRAIVSAQTNSLRGLDVLLPNQAVLRSSRFDATDRMRYSYVEPDGETYDISDIVAEEWREHMKQDVLAGVIGKNRSVVDSEKLDRVLNKIRSGKIKEREREKRARATPTGHQTAGGGSADMRSLMTETQSLIAVDSLRSISPSEYSLDDGASATTARTTRTGQGHTRSGSGSSYVTADDRAMTPATARSTTATPIGHFAGGSVSNSGTATPTGTITPGNLNNLTRRNPSIASVMSESPTTMNTPNLGATNPLPSTFGRPQQQKTSTSSSSSSSRQGYNQYSSRSKSSTSSHGSSTRRPIIPKDEFGLDHMMAVIECRAAIAASQQRDQNSLAQSEFKISPLPPLDPVDAILFGRPIDVESLHPSVRDVYAGAFKQLEEVDKLLDEFMGFNSVQVG